MSEYIRGLSVAPVIDTLIPVVPTESLIGNRVNIPGVGDYQVDGISSSGLVYFATQQNGIGSTHIALKPALIQPTGPNVGLERAAFLRQAYALTTLQNANVPHALGFLRIEEGKHKGDYFMTDFFGVEDLWTFIRRPDQDMNLPQARLNVLRIFRSVAETLEIAHRNGIVNRDIKPSNIRLNRDTAGVTDWGSIYSNREPLNHFSLQVGTAGYRPLQQTMKDHQPVPEDDFFSLGMSIYACLIKTDPEDILTFPPHPDDPTMLYIRQSALEGTIIEQLPSPFSDFLKKLTMFDEGKRQHSIREVISDIDRLIASGQY